MNKGPRGRYVTVSGLRGAVSELMAATKWSPQQTAKACGVSRPTILRWLNPVVEERVVRKGMRYTVVHTLYRGVIGLRKAYSEELQRSASMKIL